MAHKKKEIEQSILTEGEVSKIQRYSLYITGASPNSSRAVANIKRLFEANLPEMHELDIIDVYQQPQTALKANIIALPLLIRTFPLPEKRFIGDMSNLEKLVQSLNLKNP
jgi:circadian clock protein KaiB